MEPSIWKKKVQKETKAWAGTFIWNLYAQAYLELGKTSRVAFIWNQVEVRSFRSVFQGCFLVKLSSTQRSYLPYLMTKQHEGENVKALSFLAAIEDEMGPQEHVVGEPELFAHQTQRLQ